MAFKRSGVRLPLAPPISARQLKELAGFPFVPRLRIGPGGARGEQERAKSLLGQRVNEAGCWDCAAMNVGSTMQSGAIPSPASGPATNRRETPPSARAPIPTWKRASALVDEMALSLAATRLALRQV